MTRVSFPVVEGLLDNLREKLEGKDNREWVERVKIILMSDYVRTPPSLRRIWNVTLGLHKSPAEYRKAFKSASLGIERYASEIFDKIKVAKTITDIELVMISGRELGFTRRVYLDSILHRAQDLGLKLCPAEVGPAFVLDYKNQLRSEDDWFLLVAMEKLTDLADFRRIFVVGCDDRDQYLHSWCDTSPLSPDSRWLFLVSE